MASDSAADETVSTRSLHDRARLALLAAVVLLAAFVVARSGSSADASSTVTAGATGEVSILADDLVTAVGSLKGAKSAVGGTGASNVVLVTATVEGVPRDEVATWVATAVVPLTARISAAGVGHVIVFVSSVGDETYVRSVSVPGSTAANPDTYLVTPGFAQTSSEGAGRITTANTSTTTATATSSTNPTAGTETTAKPTATTAAAATTAKPATTTAPTAAAPDGSLLSDQGAWSGLAGQWRFDGDAYLQKDATGFDYITQYSTLPPASFTFSAKITAESGPVSGGLIINQPKIGKRDGATMIDITDEGSYVRWGHYNPAGGAYVFDGGVELASPVDGVAGVTLAVAIKDDQGTVLLDGRQVGTFTPASDTGFVGLVTSEASLRFRDVVLGTS